MTVFIKDITDQLELKLYVGERETKNKLKQFLEILQRAAGMKMKSDTHKKNKILME